MATRLPTPRPLRPSEPTPDDFVARIAWGLAHDAFLAPEVEAMLRLWEAGDDSSHVRRVLDEAIKLRERAEVLREARPFRLPQGLGVEGFALPLADGAGVAHVPIATLPLHLLMLGETGTGKSTTYRFLSSLWALEPTVTQTYIGLYKPDGRGLLPTYAAAGRSLAVLSPADVALNVVCPAGLTRERVYAVMPDLFARTLKLPPGAELQVRHVLADLLRKPTPPCLLDLLAALRAAPARFELAKEAAIGKVEGVVPDLLPTIARTRIGWPVGRWRAENIALELGGLSEPAKALVVTSLLFGLLGDPAPVFGVHVVCLDDAARFFATDAAVEGLGPMAELFGLVRAQGIGLVLGVQSTASLSPHVSANCGTKLILGAGSGYDYARVAADLGLRPEQVEAVRHLGRREAVVQLPRAVCPDPFLIEIPQMPAIDVDASAAAASARLVRDWPCTIATEYAAAWQPPSLADVGPRAVRGSAASRATDAAAERRFLEAVLAFPGLAASELARKAGLKDSRAILIRKALLERSWLRMHKVQRTARGRASQVLEVTPEGLRALRGQGNRAAASGPEPRQENGRTVGDAGQTSP